MCRLPERFGENVLLYGSHEWLPYSKNAVYTKSSNAKEPLNKSSTAEQRIFCSLSAVWKIGNTYSIPRFPKLSEEAKSLAVSSCRFNQSFPKNSPQPAPPGAGCYHAHTNYNSPSRQITSCLSDSASNPTNWCLQISF